MSDTPSSDVLPSPDDQAKQAATRDYERAIAECKSLVQMERENAALHSDIERHVQAAADLANENAELRAKLEEATKDAERWRYRINYEYETSCSSTAISREEWIASRTAAIDAAIAAGKGEK